MAHSDHETAVVRHEILVLAKEERLWPIIEGFDEMFNEVQVAYGGDRFFPDHLETACDANALFERLC